jgi:colicin import membrane protein
LVIVYTATDEISHAVYVGSAREDLEEHWISLVNQAEDGAEGDFFAAIRQQGASKFEIEEFGFAEDSSEMRELVREAQKDLGAIPIKAGRASGVVSHAKVLAAKAELDDLAKIDSGVAGEGWNDGSDDGWLDDRREQTSKSLSKEPAVEQKAKPALSSLDLIKLALAEAAAETGPVKKVRAAPEKPAKKAASTAATAPEKIATGRTGSAAREKRIKEELEREREAREQFRQTASTLEAAEMKSLMMGIEARRLAARKTSKTARLAEAKKKAASDRKAAAAEKVMEAKRLAALKSATSSRKVVPDTVVEEKLAPTKRDSRAEAKLLAAKVLSARTAPANLSVAPSAEAILKASPTNTPAGSKGQRIKAAIAAEKRRIDAEKRARIEAETPEMSALLSGLDSQAK